MPTSIISTAHDFYSQRVFWCWALIILFIFALFRLPGLGVPLASDELAMVSLWAQMPYLKIFSNYQYPNNHIFLSLVLSFLLKTFGLKEWLLRIPVLACGMASIYLSYQLGKRISRNTSVGFFTAFLMAISGKHIYYSTNARGYIVIMMLALLTVVYMLDRLEGRSFKIKNFSNGFNRGLAFFGWVGIWLVGTWTVPTFLFFEVSVATFLAGLILVENRRQSFQKAHLAIPLGSCLVGGIGFYLQYYVLINSAMLAEAISGVTATSFSQFFPGLLAEWMNPFEPAGILFFLFALMGLGRLLQQNRVVGFMMACVWLSPIFFMIAGFLLGKLSTIPYSRTFFYLQPFFLILGVMGVRESGIWFLTAIKRNSSFPEKSLLAMTGVLAGGLFLISGSKFFQYTYPQRLSREPLHRVHEFVKKLNPNDLLLVSHEMHVQFFLYGARDMRSRIESILREGKLGDIYFLGYKKISVSGSQVSGQREKLFLSFHALMANVGKGPVLPEEAVEVVEQFDSFTIYRLKQNWIRPIPGWEKAGLDPALQETDLFKLEKVSSPSGARPLIRFEDSFTVTMRNKSPLLLQPSGLTLNLMEIAGNKNFFSAVFLGGRLREGKIVFDPSWRVNGWVMDHPFGSDIYSRPWNPAAFISQGAAPLSVLDVIFTQRPANGALRNFMSFRIDEPGRETK